jgi:hypothetical protein
MYKTSLVDLFNAGLAVRKIIVNNKFYRQEDQDKCTLISDLLLELNKVFGFEVRIIDDFLTDLSVTRFLLQYARAYEVCSPEDESSWAFTVFFIASPVICLRGVKKGYFISVKFMSEFWDQGWLSVNAARALWFEMFEKYMWDVQEVKLASEAVVGNPRMVQVYNDIVPNAYKLTVTSPDPDIF